MAGILFLDRDGVLDAKPPEGRYVTSPAELRLLPGVAEAIARLRHELPGVPFVVVTNQRGIALGRMTSATVDAIHDVILALIRGAGGDLDGFEVCPHDLHACDCRKPGTGLLRRVLERSPGRNAADSVMVGDSLSDLQAGAAMGVRTALVGDLPGRSRTTAAAVAAGLRVDAQAGSLAALVDQGVLQGWLSTSTVLA